MNTKQIEKSKNSTYNLFYYTVFFIFFISISYKNINYKSIIQRHGHKTVTFQDFSIIYFCSFYFFYARLAELKLIK